MRNFLFALTFSLSSCIVALPQHTNHTTKEDAEEQPTLMWGMGSHHHPVSTTNAEAQKFFDQGLSFVYALIEDLKR